MRKIVSVLAMLFLMSTIAFSQSRTVTGKVSDDVGKAIPFASIAEKGTKNGVSADADGIFKITIKKNVLVVSATGFATKDVTVTGDVANVSLSVSAASMDEVIVTGVVGATDKKKMTVSVTKISAERLNEVPATSLASALSGKVAGVKATSVGGVPGQAMDIQLRADNNLDNVSSAPLIIVDGVILAGSLADINADDVESMEVVKGAAASALYGSRAGNGVIAVITKRGKGVGLNQVKITVRNEVGFQNLAHELEVASHHPYDLAADWETAKGKYTKYKGVTYPSDYIGAGFDPGISGNRPVKADHYMDNSYGVVRDNQADFFKTGINYTNFASISTRTEKNNLYTSFENNDQQGIIQSTDGYKRQNFRVNFDQTVTKWLKLSASNLFINRQTQAPGGGGTLFYNIARMEPDVSLNQVNPDGQPYYLRVNQFVGEVTNPLYSLWKQKNNQTEKRWLGNYTANVKFTDWANLDASYSVEIRNTRNTTYNPRDTWSRSGGTPANKGQSYTGGSLSKGSSEANNQNTQFTLNLAHEFGDLSVRSRLSYLYESAVYEAYNVSASKFAIRNIPDFSNFPSIDAANSSNTTQRAQNYFAIVSLDYKGKYLLDGMYRYDGSSLFGSEARWNPYYRISGAYRISQDIHINGIDELKIRAAKGTAGIRPGFDWQYEVYSLSNGVASASQKGNKLLKPSKTDETEVGLNVNFLKKFTFEGTYASSVTSDQFLNVPLIPFLNDGFNSQWQNAGSVKSNTIELTLGANWIKTGDLKWSSNIVYSRIRQKITSLPIAPYLFGNGSFGDQDMFYIKEGETYGSMYGNRTVNSLDEMSKQLPAGKTIADYEINSDGYVIAKGTQGTKNEAAMQKRNTDGSLWFGKIGDGNSNFNMGISNTLTYKGVTLYFLLDWKQGGDVYNGKEQRLAFNYMSKRQDMNGVPVAQKKAYDYWSSSTGFYNANDPYSYWVEDGSYVKLREVALGYSFPARLLKVFKGTVKGINAKVIGRNLLTITNYSGYDPEVGSLRQPYDGIYMNPNYRNVAFSLSLDF
ncbi:MAG: SusC/RagA family TonB-linked outer membrane protein [Ginsengibacter sp.]